MDLFLLNNVVVIGCGLDLCEYDLYFLLCCKKRHFNHTTTTLFVPASEVLDTEKEMILRTYGVKIERIEGKQYINFYKSAAAIFQNGNQRM